MAVSYHAGHADSYGNGRKSDALKRLQAQIGYTFTDRKLLERAMTHSSYSNESGAPNHHLLCNERLEFLGDSVLSIIVSEYLFRTYPQDAEGDLTCMRKDVVRAEALARYARKIHLGDCLLLGVGEDRGGGRDKENILADAFESLLAAMYLDAGESGKTIVSDFLLPMVKEDLEDLENHGTDGDYKTPLQQFIQQNEGDVLEYCLVHEEGPDHHKMFEVEARLYSGSVAPSVIVLLC